MQAQTNAVEIVQETGPTFLKRRCLSDRLLTREFFWKFNFFIHDDVNAEIVAIYALLCADSSWANKWQCYSQPTSFIEGM